MPVNSLALRVSLDCGVALKTKIEARNQTTETKANPDGLTLAHRLNSVVLLIIATSVVTRHFTEIPKLQAVSQDERMREGNLRERECELG
jgi:hypothetical protein